MNSGYIHIIINIYKFHRFSQLDTLERCRSYLRNFSRYLTRAHMHTCTCEEAESVTTLFLLRLIAMCFKYGSCEE